MVEAVEFIHAEGWDAPPTLFALVPSHLLVDQLDQFEHELDDSPLTLVVQDNLPDNILPGSEELAEYVSRLAWPEEIEGVILAQEIKFRDASAPANSPAQPARLFSGVLREEDLEQTLLQLRPTEEELAEKGPFAQDEIELRGGPDVAPGVIAALRYGLERDPEDML
ncbi:PPA1309 family protein [Corynebacterium breve]|uniref:PPA1309 family protein n=1 Tax=Corynebacterium breve TaxID=3049799 RepID=A0ABY8VK05_9CORY|nr:PPA1309 family protein [Corynebacterium breve]WIM68993.1 PPA1309 family protein [Corynebacterium breve]